MQLTQPDTMIPGDRADRILARTTDMVGFNSTKAVWRAGMLAGSDAAVAYGIRTPVFYWYLTNHRGGIHEKWEGFAADLPPRFRSVLDGPWKAETGV